MKLKIRKRIKKIFLKKNLLLILFIFIIMSFLKIEFLKNIFFKINDKVRIFKVEKITEKRIEEFSSKIILEKKSFKDEKKYWIEK